MAPSASTVASALGLTALLLVAILSLVLGRTHLLGCSHTAFQVGYLCVLYFAFTEIVVVVNHVLVGHDLQLRMLPFIFHLE